MDKENERVSVSYNGVLLRLTDAEEDDTLDALSVKVISITTKFFFPLPKVMKQLWDLLQCVDKIRSLPFSTLAKYSDQALSQYQNSDDLTAIFFFKEYMRLAGHSFDKASQDEILIYLSSIRTQLSVTAWLLTSSPDQILIGSRVLLKLGKVAFSEEDRCEVLWQMSYLRNRLRLDKLRVSNKQLLFEETVHDAFKYAAKGSLTAFRSLTLRMLAEYPIDYVFYYAKLCLQYGETALAKQSFISYLQTAVKKAPAFVCQAQLHLVRIFKDEGRFEDALEYLNAAVELCPHSPMVIKEVQNMIEHLDEFSARNLISTLSKIELQVFGSVLLNTIVMLENHVNDLFERTAACDNF